ncbi:MAG TPA: hypothetical protein VFS47_10065 [Steroidobacteraceae bacterium]|nr:hypothetical protein [Steroidobacteraceae bacterium]
MIAYGSTDLEISVSDGWHTTLPVFELNDAGLTSYVIEGLGSGTYYFAITALSSAALKAQSLRSRVRL